MGETFRVVDTGESFTILSIASETSLTATRNATTTEASSAAEVIEHADNIRLESIVGIDVGDTALAGNEELLRISHARGVSIGSAVAYTDGALVSAQYLLQINDSADVSIAVLGGENVNSGFVSIDGASDVDPPTFGGDVSGLRIGRLFGKCQSNNAIGVNTSFTVRDNSINLDGVSGFATNLLLWSSGTLTGPFKLTGLVLGSVSPIYSGAPASDNFIVEVAYSNKRVIGRPAGARNSALLELLSAVFSGGNSLPTGLWLGADTGTAAQGNYGNAIEFGRVGTTRRGAAIAMLQTGTNGFDTGLSFWTGGTSTGTDSLNEALRLHHTKAMQIPDGITAPATTAGWASLYVDVADGDYKVKFGDGVVKTITVDT